MLSMTKILLASIFMLITGTILSGQNNSFELGIEGGISKTTLWGNESLSGKDFILNYSGGMTVQYHISESWAIRSGLLFEQKGIAGTLIDTSLSTRVNWELKFSYLTIPLLFRYQFGNNKVKYFVNSGMYLGYLRGVDSRAVLEAEQRTVKTDISDWYVRSDAGITFGAGIRIPFSEKILFSAEVRDNLGLKNTSALPVYHDGSIRHHAIAILMGVSYAFGVK